MPPPWAYTTAGPAPATSWLVGSAPAWLVLVYQRSSMGAPSLVAWKVAVWTPEDGGTRPAR